MSRSRLRRLEVRLTAGPEEQRVVGWLVERRGRCFFEYSADFLREPLWLSPFKLPSEPGLHEHRDLNFGPVFGLFDDSLPDGWGLLLMDRFLRGQGLALGEISVLDRLAFLGTRTMGALTYHPPASSTSGAELIDLAELASASRRVLEGPEAEVLPQLVRAGGSPGGARPKVLVAVREGELRSGEDELPPGFTAWIVKFRAPEDAPDSGSVELAYALMAREAGIEMPETRLFVSRDGDRFFGVRRFDRDGEERLHVHTFGNLIHSNYRIPEADYLDLLKVTRVLTRNHQDVLEAFRRMVFNVATNNRDDHVKNFAFRMSWNGEWRLAPAYDLVHSRGPGGEHTMSIAGEGRAPTLVHLFQVADRAGLSSREADGIIGTVLSAVEGWARCAGETGVSVPSARRIQESIATHLERLG